MARKAKINKKKRKNIAKHAKHELVRQVVKKIEKRDRLKKSVPIKSFTRIIPAQKVTVKPSTRRIR
jgi:hypothetical protein